MNLPNALTVARIALTPPVALLPFVDTAAARAAAFVLFVVAGLTDYLDGRLARSRRDETDLGKILDPLADKLLLVGTLVPMFVLAGSGSSAGVLSPHRTPFVPDVLGPVARGDGAAFPFLTPLGLVGLPWWVLAVVLGREAAMTLFRQAAARRGVIISAIGPAKWKTALQSVWVGAAYFWFFAATAAATYRWTSAPWRAFAYFNGIVGTAAMVGATALAVYSLWLYVRRYGGIFRRAKAADAGDGRGVRAGR